MADAQIISLVDKTKRMMAEQLTAVGTDITFLPTRKVARGNLIAAVAFIFRKPWLVQNDVSEENPIGRGCEGCYERLSKLSTNLEKIVCERGKVHGEHGEAGIVPLNIDDKPTEIEGIIVFHGSSLCTDISESSTSGTPVDGQAPVGLAMNVFSDLVQTLKEVMESFPTSLDMEFCRAL